MVLQEENEKVDGDWGAQPGQKEQYRVGGGLAGVIGHFSDLSYWHATTKTYAYFGGFGFFRVFFRQKSDPTMVKSHF